MDSVLFRISGQRTLAAVFLVGTAVSVYLTIILRQQSDARAVGFLFVCSIATVPEPRLPGALFTFAVEPVALFLLAFVGFIYLRAFLVARGRGRNSVLPAWRGVCFFAGLLLILATVFGPLAAYSRGFLALHMVQHFILITFAPPLLLAGRPFTLTLMLLSPARRNQCLRLTGALPWRALTHPGLGVALFAVVPLGWYISPAFRASLSNEAVHYAGFAMFLFAGVHYWWPIVGRQPTHWPLSPPVQLVYLFALVPIHALLGSLFYQPSHVIFPELAQVSRNWGPSPLFDQQIAGMIMLVAGELIGLIALLWAASRWASKDEERAKRSERRSAAQSQGGTPARSAQRAP